MSVMVTSHTLQSEKNIRNFHSILKVVSPGVPEHEATVLHLNRICISWKISKNTSRKKIAEDTT